MIRPIDIRLNAAHPELPLAEAVTYTGSPSTALIRGVPPNCGRWAITAIFVAASFPDGSTTTRAAVQSANGVWVATLPATATSGRTANGIRVMADGVDENGEAVTGYILGVADFAVASLAVTPAPEPGGTAYALRYFDALPDPAKKGDVTRIDGDLKFYNGTAWVGFSAESISNLAEELSRLADNLSANYYNAEETDEAIDKLAAYYITYTAAGAAFPTFAALAGATTYYSGGAVRIPTRNDYAVVLADETHGGAEWRYIYAVADGETVGQWEAQYPIETNDYAALSNKPQINCVTVEGNRQGCDYGLVDANRTTVAIGSNARVSPCSMGVAIGCGAGSDCDSVAIGGGAYASDCDSVAIGGGAYTSNCGSVAIGPCASTCDARQTAIGSYANTRGSGEGVAIGCGAGSECNSVAIGGGAYTDYGESVAIGPCASTCGTGQTAIGSYANTHGCGNGIAIGCGANVATFDYEGFPDSANGIAIGGSASVAYAGEGIAIGNQATVCDNSAGIAIGHYTATSCDSIAIGSYANSSCGGAVAIGSNAYNLSGCAVSIGPYAATCGTGQIAIGVASVTGVDVEGGIAMGHNASTYGNGVAIGVYAISCGDSIAIGPCASTNNPDEISFGFGSCGVVTVSGAKWRAFIQTL